MIGTCILNCLEAFLPVPHLEFQNLVVYWSTPPTSLNFRSSFSALDNSYLSEIFQKDARNLSNIMHPFWTRIRFNLRVTSLFLVPKLMFDSSCNGAFNGTSYQFGFFNWWDVESRTATLNANREMQPITNNICTEESMLPTKKAWPSISTSDWKKLARTCRRFFCTVANSETALLFIALT